jgi:endo-1,4-beta-xylanase
MDQIAAEPSLHSALLEDCDSLTPEIHLKWDALQPAREVWTTEPADRLIAFAQRNGMKVRGHALLWDQSTPAWARSAIADGDWSVIEAHFRTVLGRYAEKVDEWDVVNEPIDAPQGKGGLRDNLFHRGLGPDYVARALTTARALAPKARLMINEYGFEYDNYVEEGRRTAMLRLVESLRKQGTPLDGVGLQAHLDLSKGPLKPEILDRFLRDLADLEVYIAVTELDVNEHDRGLSLRERDRRVADETRRYLDIVLAHSAVRGVTTWGLSDRHSWLQDQLAAGSPTNRGLPFDRSFQPKPMRDALVSALAA